MAFIVEPNKVQNYIDYCGNDDGYSCECYMGWAW